jgi:hypothetical protein
MFTRTPLLSWLCETSKQHYPQLNQAFKPSTQFKMASGARRRYQ